jgi:hypothetical protein
MWNGPILFRQVYEGGGYCFPTLRRCLKKIGSPDAEGFLKMFPVYSTDWV